MRTPSTNKTPGPRVITREIADGDEDKYFLNGIVATILAIQRYWYAITNPNWTSDLSAKAFCSTAKFQETYARVQALYPKRKPVGKGLWRTINRITNQEKNIDFTDMRAFAEFVKLPTGLFLLFSQCVSDERHAGGDTTAARREVLELMRRVRSVVDATEEYIKNRPENQSLFCKKAKQTLKSIWQM